MFDKKYKKTLEVIDDEISFYNDLFRKNIKLAETCDGITKDNHLKRADECLEKRIALDELKTRILNVVRDL